MFKTHLRRRDQTGGAISLWVVLMTPIAAFAAVVAMAGPQRLAAESSIDETAADLAAFSVALRDGRDVPTGELKGFLPDCERVVMPSSVTDSDEIDRWTNQIEHLEAACQLLLGDPEDSTKAAYWLRDLGYLGIEANSWEGFYSDAVTASDADCVISGNLETRNAVYAALAADWQDAGWAAAQVWPDGVRMGSEQVARLHQSVPPNSQLDRCEDEFDTPPNPDPARTVFTN